MLETHIHPSEILPFLLDGKGAPPPGFAGELQPDPGRVTGPPRTVFVIDDEPSIADSLTEILKSQGYEAVPFYTGNSAIEAARRECPDIVLSDVVMPRIDGVDTVIAICKVCPRAQIVLFSGQATVSDVIAKGREKGYNFELLPKPIHPDRLLKKLASLKKRF